MTKFKVENKTNVPIMFALFEQPQIGDIPTKNGVLKPGESKEWGAGNVLLGEYKVYGVMAGDNESHPEWNYNCPGTTIVASTLQLGFKMWHDGDIDWENIMKLSSEDLEATFGCQYTSAQSKSVSWNGFSSCILQFTGGPDWVAETTSLYRPKQPAMDTVTSTPMYCK